MKITVETPVHASIEDVWRAWTTPADIKQWNAASDDWHTTRSTVDLRVGGAFSSRMEAKDGSMGFDFEGTYTRIEPHRLIECSLGDRELRVEFIEGTGNVTVRETFDAEDTFPVEQQRAGWQAILDNFARHVERRAAPASVLRGSCLCGAVTFEASGAHSPIEACHCVQCRKWTGHFFANIEVARDNLTINGEDHITWHRSSGKVRRGFCATCGSTLFFDPLDRDKHQWIGVAMGALDTPTSGRIALHIFTAEKGDYYDIPADEKQNAR